MVNKILTLFDMEFKRVQKIFFTIISLLILGNILAFARGIYWTINYQGAQTKVKQGLGVLTNNLLINLISITKSFSICFIFSTVSEFSLSS